MASLDRVEREATAVASSRNMPGSSRGDRAPAGRMETGRYSTVTRTRTSAGRLRLTLSDPVNAFSESREKLSLGPERLISQRTLRGRDERTAPPESSVVAEIVKEELRGEAGEQIMRQVRRIVKREIGRYASRHDLS